MNQLMLPLESANIIFRQKTNNKFNHPPNSKAVKFVNIEESMFIRSRPNTGLFTGAINDLTHNTPLHPYT